MSIKATVVAPSNIAFIKYWGTRDPARTLPFNPSLSMTLRRCATRTTVAGLGEAGADEVLVPGPAGGLEPAPSAFAAGVVTHLEQLRARSGSGERFRVATQNTFPMGAGLASSASGFAALALAVMEALGRSVSDREASLLARSSGSGSSARSVFGGYVQWPAEGDAQGSATQLLPAAHWDLRDVITIVDSAEKEISSRQGHRRAPTSPYFEPRLQRLDERLADVRSALEQRAFEPLAELVEEEAIELHLIAMSSRPPIFYWRPATLRVLEVARRMRAAGVEVCFTMDAGANVHLICTPKAEPAVVEELSCLPEVESIIRDGVGDGPVVVEDHLF